MQSHQVFFGRPVCLIHSTSHIIRLTQSLSSFRSMCPNHLNLLFLIIKLTGSNPKSSLSSSLLFLSFSLTPHIHLIILISVQFSFNSCSTFIGHVSLPCFRQLTQVAYTRILSQLEWVSIHETFFQPWLLLLNHILHLHPTYLLNNRIYLPFPAISHYQYPDANQY